MKVSAKTDYAARALLELAAYWPSTTPLQVSTIADRQNIPLKFLTQILLNLKQMGYVKSTRGKNGGYLLAQLPKDIKLSDLIKHFDGFAGETSAKGSNQVMDFVWGDVQKTLLKAIDTINFETILNRKRSQENVVMFEI